MSKGNTTQLSMVNWKERSLPPHGKGYRTYSYLGSALGRQYAHHKVIATLEDAFTDPHDATGQTFDVAVEVHGGKFLPHFTHREGMSVDIMTMKKGDKPARLSTGPLSLWGYCWHIDAQSNRQNGLKWDAPSTSKYLCPTIPINSEKVDFDVLREMIIQLKRSAKEGGNYVCDCCPILYSTLKRAGVRLS